MNGIVFYERSSLIWFRSINISCNCFSSSPSWLNKPRLSLSIEEEITPTHEGTEKTKLFSEKVKAFRKSLTAFSVMFIRKFSILSSACVRVASASCWLSKMPAPRWLWLIMPTCSKQVISFYKALQASWLKIHESS